MTLLHATIAIKVQGLIPDMSFTAPLGANPTHCLQLLAKMKIANNNVATNKFNIFEYNNYYW